MLGFVTLNEASQLLHNKFVVILGGSGEKINSLHFKAVYFNQPRHITLQVHYFKPPITCACVSVQRSMYKDLVLLLQKDTFLTSSQLTTKVKWAIDDTHNNNNTFNLEAPFMSPKVTLQSMGIKS